MERDPWTLYGKKMSPHKCFYATWYVPVQRDRKRGLSGTREEQANRQSGGSHIVLTTRGSQRKNTRLWLSRTSATDCKTYPWWRTAFWLPKVSKERITPERTSRPKSAQLAFVPKVSSVITISIVELWEMHSCWFLSGLGRDGQVEKERKGERSKAGRQKEKS